MPCGDGSLIVGGRSGCIGCPCALALSFPDSRRGRDALEPGDGLDGNPERGHNEPSARALDSWGPGDRQIARAALLVFGAPLLLLLLSAGGTAAFVPEWPTWALLGLVPLLGRAAVRRKTRS